MKFESLLKNLKELNLPKRHYAIAGSGPMAVRKIRDSNDLDVVVTKETFNDLKERFPNNFVNEPFDRLVIGDIEISHIWQQGEEKSIKSINKSEIINGVPFVKLNEVLIGKKKGTRDKDKKDVELIENYLRNKK